MQPEQTNTEQTLPPAEPPKSSELVAEPQVTVPVRKQRHFLAVFFFSFFWGVFGVDRFYLGKVWTGILKLLTFGGFFIWAMIDLSLITSGAMRDSKGQELLQADEYRTFAKRVVLWFAVITGVLVILFIASLVYAILQIFNAVQGGALQDLVPGGGVPDMSQLRQLIGI